MDFTVLVLSLVDLSGIIKGSISKIGRALRILKLANRIPSVREMLEVFSLRLISAFFQVLVRICVCIYIYIYIYIISIVCVFRPWLPRFLQWLMWLRYG